MNREYHKWYSPKLQRDMELLIFGHAGAKVLIFPTRCDRFYQYEDLGLVNALAHKIEQGYMQLYCVDGIDVESFYCCWCPPPDRIRRHLQYEGYILDEVMPLMAHRNPHPCTIAHGCSFGAFHAVNIAFRHPHRFQKVVALSGRYDLSVPVEDFRGLFDGYYDENMYFNTPNHFIPNLTDGWVLHHLRNMDIVLVVGEQDPFLDSNHQLSEALWNRCVGHGLHVWNGRAHNVHWWRKMVELYV